MARILIPLTHDELLRTEKRLTEEKNDALNAQRIKFDHWMYDIQEEIMNILQDLDHKDRTYRYRFSFLEKNENDFIEHEKRRLYYIRKFAQKGYEFEKIKQTVEQHPALKAQWEDFLVTYKLITNNELGNEKTG